MTSLTEPSEESRANPFQPSTDGMQPSTSRPQPSTSGMQPRTSHPQPSTSGMQPSTSRPQPGTNQDTGGAVQNTSGQRRPQQRYENIEQLLEDTRFFLSTDDDNTWPRGREFRDMTPEGRREYAARISHLLSEFRRINGAHRPQYDRQSTIERRSARYRRTSPTEPVLWEPDPAVALVESEGSDSELDDFLRDYFPENYDTYYHAHRDNVRLTRQEEANGDVEYDRDPVVGDQLLKAESKRPRHRRGRDHTLETVVEVRRLYVDDPLIIDDYAMAKRACWKYKKWYQNDVPVHMVRWVRDEKRRLEGIYAGLLSHVDHLKEWQKTPRLARHLDILPFVEDSIIWFNLHRQYDEIIKKYKRHRHDFPKFGKQTNRDTRKVKAREIESDDVSADESVSDVESLEQVSFEAGSPNLQVEKTSSERMLKISKSIRNAFHRLFSCRNAKTVVQPMPPPSPDPQDIEQTTSPRSTAVFHGVQSSPIMAIQTPPGVVETTSLSAASEGILETRAPDPFTEMTSLPSPFQEETITNPAALQEEASR